MVTFLYDLYIFFGYNKYQIRLFCHSNIKSYAKYPKISNSKESDKMTYANSADPDQTAPSALFAKGN